MHRFVVFEGVLGTEMGMAISVRTRINGLLRMGTLVARHARERIAGEATSGIIAGEELFLLRLLLLRLRLRLGRMNRWYRQWFFLLRRFHSNHFLFHLNRVNTVQYVFQEIVIIGLRIVVKGKRSTDHGSRITGGSKHHSRFQWKSG